MGIIAGTDGVIEDARDRGVTGTSANIAATRVFTVKLDGRDNPVNEPFVAYDASGIPAVNSLHPYKSNLYVKQKTVSYLGPHFYKVAVEYSDESSGGYKNPLFEPPVVTWSFISSNEKIDVDINGKAFRNSSGESFDPPITEDVYDLVLRIVENKSKFDHVKASQYINTVNSSTFWGFAKGTVILFNISAEEFWVGGIKYARVTREYKIRKDGWLRKIRDEGFSVLKTGGLPDNVLDGSAGRPAVLRIYSLAASSKEKPQPITEPVGLNGRGKLLSPGAKAVFLDFQTKKSMNLNNF